VDWPLLEGVPEDARRQLLSAARRRRFAKGEVVFHEGDPGDTLHLVAAGRLAVRVVTETGDTAMLTILGPGDFFGLLALLADGSPRRSAGIRALDRAETLAIRQGDLDALRAAHPSVDDFLLRVLGHQVRRLTESLTEALYTPAETRVLRRLLDAATLWGGPNPGTEVPLTQEELGQLAGTTRATTNQVLRQAEHLGLVAIGRGKVTLVDCQGLARRAGVR
jgi:CRP/FNR family transcriptional regulator, cyclic AMP receptor protein